VCFVVSLSPAIMKIVHWSLITFVLLLQGACARKAAPVQEPSIEQVLERLQRCASQEGLTETLSIAIKSATLEPAGLRIIASISASEQRLEFDLPVYRLSSGRWLINGKGRAYVMDENCRQYKLSDRKRIEGYDPPIDGHLSLKPGQRFESALIFPRLQDRAKAGLLVYDDRILAFRLGLETTVK
jgi:hypothetical protein